MPSKHKRAIYPIHPGSVLADELAELELSAAELARTLRIPYSRVYRLVSGRRPMTADMALRLQQWLGVSADFWMNLQNATNAMSLPERLVQKLSTPHIAARRPS